MKKFYYRFDSATDRRPPLRRALALCWLAALVLGLAWLIPLAARLLQYPAAPAAARAVAPADWLPPWLIAPNGAVFGETPADPFAAPRPRLLKLPEMPGTTAIWGSTGRDHRGHIWLGVTGAKSGSAHLCEYIPEEDIVIDRGNVLDELKKLNLYRPGMRQIKIHSRIVQARDGCLYFTSMDESGEHERKQRNPTWGSHLWRLRLSDCRWEHLLAAPEGLIALSCSGRYVYALGYFGHVLYQYDPVTGAVRAVRVGSIGGHVSRNFLSDARDHVYVPRLRRDLENSPQASLVEYDDALNKVAETPLPNYLNENGNLVNSHGIIGIQPLRDGSIAFLTHPGMLYRIRPPVEGDRDGPAAVERLGFFHPAGSMYVPSLFTYDGRRYLMGVTDDWDWTIYDLAAKTARAEPLDLTYHTGQDFSERHLLYGSIARDDQGCFYLVGTDQKHDRPIAVQLQPKMK